MKAFITIRWLLVPIGLGMAIGAGTQTYIKRLNRPEQSHHRKILLFGNGDLLIGDSFPEGAAEDGTTALFLTRMDACGLVLWSYAFEKEGLRLIFRDFVISEEEEVYVLGSAIDGLRESAFLLEVSGEGERQGFRIFDGQTPGISPFSIDLRDDKLLTFGRLLEIGAETTGFLAGFDRNLNYVWGKKITPFTFEGKAIFAASGQVVARSKGFHYLFTAEGELMGGKEFPRNLQPEPIAGPVAVSGGYVYEAFGPDQAFFYKLDPAGQLVWQSPQFSSTLFPAAISEISGGNLLVHYNAPLEDGNQPAQLVLSPGGTIEQHRLLNSANTFNVGSVDHAFAGSGRLNLIGNHDALTTEAADITDYLLQFSLTDLSSDCFEWWATGSSVPNDYLLTFSDRAVTTAALFMNTSAPGGLTRFESEAPFYEECGAIVEPEIIPVDTLLDCRENWAVRLPATTFTWEDGYPEPDRLLDQPGIYRAKNNDCELPVVLAYQVERADCDCRIYLPNAFSPNDDGYNDTVQLFSDCQVEILEALVFDRWGNLIFRTRDAGQLWDGTHAQREAPTGVYLLKVDYRSISDTGGESRETQWAEVLLIR